MVGSIANRTYGNGFPLHLMADLWPWRNHKATVTTRQATKVYIAELSGSAQRPVRQLKWIQKVAIAYLLDEDEIEDEVESLVRNG